MGDAGAVLTSSPEIAGIVKRLHQYGWEEKYTVANAGGRNSRMDELQAAILSVLLPHLDDINAERRFILDAYKRAAPDGVEFVHSGDGSVVHLAVALTDQRNALRSHLADKGISTEIHYPILDCDQPGWCDLPQRIGRGGLEHSRQGSRRALSLPCFAGMNREEIDHVANALSSFRVP